MPSNQNSAETLSFLETLGSTDRGDDVVLSNTSKALVDLADFLIETATNNLDRKGNTATGQTASSMKAVNVQVTGTKASLDIEILDTYKFLDQGVKGTQGGRGKYAFKTSYPNAKMAAEIRAWLRVRKVATKYKAVSANERKNKRIKKLVQSKKGKLTALSYAIATNIKKKGIKPTRFFSDAVKATEKRAKVVYAEAIKLDIIESLKNT